MVPTTRNLSISTIRDPLDEWSNELVSLIEEYPFERRLREQLPAGADRTRWDLQQQDFRLALLAKFSGTPVGWVQVHEPLPGGPLWIRRERLQRNRTDLRLELIEFLQDSIGNTPWVLAHPTQNRTARQELSRFDKITRIDHFLGFVLTPEDLDQIGSSPRELPNHPLIKSKHNSDPEPGNFLRRPLSSNQKIQLHLSSPSDESPVQSSDQKLLVWIAQDHDLIDPLKEIRDPVGKRAWFRYQP